MAPTEAFAGAVLVDSGSNHSCFHSPSAISKDRGVPPSKTVALKPRPCPRLNYYSPKLRQDRVKANSCFRGVTTLVVIAA
ncbi:hypothetical protein Q3G72_002332 [Acer saccharum]|nr:hypothetical protein Q3G72_002332 [Acer saccharum]